MISVFRILKNSFKMDTAMKLDDLGYNNIFEKFRVDQKLDNCEIGRVISEHKERYIVRTSFAEFESEITGNMRFSATSREDFPAVGDWVALTTFDASHAIIQKIFPRFSIIKRQAVGKFGEIQIIATNIDFAFLIQAVDRDFSINRLERYLTICHSSNVSPIILLSKTDLTDEQRVCKLIESIKLRIKNVLVIALSNESLNGIKAIKSLIETGKTYCMLGSSGVGKSTLINNLSGRNIMKTDSISQSTNKGKHVTSHRELVVLENGGILIDNPGMREVGIVDSSIGLDTTFDTIINLSESCKYNNCTHTTETGCSVIESVAKGELEKNTYENFLRLEREKAHFESSFQERRKKDKDFGKMMKNYHKDMKNTKF